jgi:tRNA(Ile)-lysidine synthetase-like protein
MRRLPPPPDGALEWDGRADLRLPPGCGVLHAVRPATAELPLRIVFARGGERLKPAGARYTRTLRNLFQEEAFPPWIRERLPLVELEGELAAVVAQELLAGVRGRAAATLEHAILEPFERRRRVLLPSYQAWKETGAVLAALVASGSARWPNVCRSLVNDVLLAMSCREAGVVLVTLNTRDFARIAEVRPFDFVAPWPVPMS